MKTARPTIVVGIGSSAGGSSALRQFFSQVSDSDQISLVIVQHLDSVGARLALEILKTISPMPVEEIASGKTLLAGRVYLAPSHGLVSLSKGFFSVRTAQTTEEKLSVVDHLFTSLAQELNERAVGVILSGEASDGSLGVQEINLAGGLTIAQTPTTAEHPAMPQHAIATQSIDQIADADEIPHEIENYLGYLSSLENPADQRKLKDQISTALTSICEILHKQTQHDFKHYKTSTLVRRIQRRMQVLDLWTVEGYLERLANHEDEVETLFQELLIHVTCFFRDEDSFEAVKNQVLQKLITDTKPNQKIRVWVPGCSTGEEAYTLAMLFHELIAHVQSPPEIQIIATDIDEASLQVARRGSYPLSIAERVSPARLSNFFRKSGGKYNIRPEIRELCLFSIHNLINDPPFSQIDFISCRNLLIYLGPHLQKKLFPIFHYSLKPNGFLFLGTSESLSTHRELFKPIDSKHRIAQRKETAVKLPSISTSVQNYLSHFQDSEKITEADISLISQRIALDEMPLRYAVINEEGQILSASGNMEKYIQIPEGSFQNNIVKLAKPSLRAALRSAFQIAQKEKRKVINENCTLKTSDGTERVGIIVQPMPQLGEQSALFWVAFQYLGNSNLKDKSTDQLNAGVDLETVDQLERELTVLRAELDRSVQDLEASNEELKSSNEELLSMNEELQSANEELETSKEEVQQANEALLRANLDLENLLAGTQIATLFLDGEYRIRGFTPAVQDLFPIQPSDVGRDLSNFQSHASRMLPLPEIDSVTDLTPHETEVLMPNGTAYLRRVIPYCTQDNVRDGVVVTFLNVTNLRNAEANYRQLANSMPNIVWTAEPDGNITYFNERWYEFTGYDHGTKGDNSWTPILHPEDLESCQQTWIDSVKSGKSYEIEYRFWDRKNSGYRWFMGRAVPVRDSKGQIVKWFGSCVDIHDRVTAEESRRETEKRFQIMADTAPVLIWISGTDKLCNWFNKGWLQWTGRSMKEEFGNGWVEGVHPDDLDRCVKIYVENFEAHKEFYMEYRLRHHSGEYRWISDRGVPRFTPDGTFEGYIGGCMDIHDQKMANEDLMENERMLDQVFSESPSFMSLLSVPDFRWEKANEEYYKLIGHRDLIGKKVTDVLPEIESQGFLQLLNTVAETKQPFVGSESFLKLEGSANEPAKEVYLDFVYQPLIRPDGELYAIAVLGYDVTEKVVSRKTLERSKHAIEVERQNFQNLFRQTPEMVCILDGPEHRFEFVNDAHIKALGFDATGMTVRKAQPESVEVHGILDQVYQTGKTAELREIPVTVTDRLRYFNLTYAARRDDSGNINGVMILGTEITEQVLASQLISASEQRLKDVLESMSDAFFTIDENWIITQVNAQHEKMTGRKRDEQVGKQYFDLFLSTPELKKTKYWKALTQAMIDRAPVRFEEYYEPLKIWTDCRVYPTPDGGLAIFFSDISEHRKAQRRLQTLLDTIPIFAGVLSHSGIITLVNEIAVNVIGETKIAVLGQPFWNGAWWKSLPETVERLKVAIALAAKGESQRFDSQYVAIINGAPEIRWVDLSIIPLFNETGGLDGLTATGYDITDRVKMQIDLDRSKTEAERANASKSVFLANMSHEIRTPLAAIIGFSDLMSESFALDDDANDYVHRISRNASQLRQLIDELLDLSKIEADRFEIEESEIDFETLLEDVYSTIELRAREKGLQLEFKWRTPRPQHLITDRVRLAQILTNIIGNAVKFTEQGHVIAEFGANENTLEVRVTDSGIGLSPEQQARIFQPFMQADSSVTRKFGGTGLGLALSRKLAQRLGGDLRLEKSALGQGSVFVITIAIREPKDRKLTSEKSLTKEILFPASLEGRKILVVDDSPDNRIIVTRFLTSLKPRIFEASNGIEAIQIHAKENMDLILMDIQMPVMDGYQAMEQLREAQFSVPVIALTAHALKEEKARCLQAGFRDYITKPINRSNLIEVVIDTILKGSVSSS